MSNENVIANQCVTCRQFWVGQHVCSFPPLKGNKEVSDEIKLGSLEFKSEDFDDIYSEGGKASDVKMNASWIANRILREKLAKAPKAYRYYVSGIQPSTWAETVPQLDPLPVTHTARLVCIELNMPQETKHVVPKFDADLLAILEGGGE